MSAPRRRRVKRPKPGIAGGKADALEVAQLRAEIGEIRSAAYEAFAEANHAAEAVKLLTSYIGVLRNDLMLVATLSSSSDTSVRDTLHELCNNMAAVLGSTGGSHEHFEAAMRHALTTRQPLPLPPGATFQQIPPLELGHDDTSAPEDDFEAAASDATQEEIDPIDTPGLFGPSRPSRPRRRRLEG